MRNSSWWQFSRKPRMGGRRGCQSLETAVCRRKKTEKTTATTTTAECAKCLLCQVLRRHNTTQHASAFLPVLSNVTSRGDCPSTKKQKTDDGHNYRIVLSRVASQQHSERGLELLRLGLALSGASRLLSQNPEHKHAEQDKLANRRIGVHM